MEYDEEWASRTDPEFPTLSVADAHRLSEELFRATFREIVGDFINHHCRSWAEENMLFLPDRLQGRRYLDTLTTAEMREIVLANQYWFDPDGGHPVPPDPYSLKGALT
jgi:hypothetical protein